MRSVLGGVARPALDAGVLDEARGLLAKHLRRDPGYEAALSLMSWLAGKLETAQRIQ